MYAKVTAMLRTNGEELDPIGAFQIPGVLRDWHSEIRRFFSEAKSFPPKPCGIICIYNCRFLDQICLLACSTHHHHLCSYGLVISSSSKYV